MSIDITETCGDCYDGRCHWGGEASRASEEAAQEGREYTASGRCGCARHDISVTAREADQATGTWT